MLAVNRSAGLDVPVNYHHALAEAAQQGREGQTHASRSDYADVRRKVLILTCVSIFRAA
jgi:hypothetical protein